MSDTGPTIPGDTQLSLAPSRPIAWETFGIVPPHRIWLTQTGLSTAWVMRDNTQCVSDSPLDSVRDHASDSVESGNVSRETLRFGP